MSSKKAKTLLSFLFFISAFLLIGGTFAWFTGKDERVNRVDAPNGKIQIRIEGNLHPLILSPGLTVERQVMVRNESEQSIFVRASLKEIIANLEVDVTDKTGNAHLKDYSKKLPAPNPTVLFEDDSTWQVNDYYQEEDGEIHQVTQVTSYLYQGTPLNTRPASFESVELVLGKVFDDFQPTETGYWLYHEGFYYYSEPLLPTNVTSNLVDKVSLTADAPNQMKGSLYNETVEAEGVIRNNTVYGAWGIPENPANPVYQLLNKQL